jgi:hypothetical protein
MGRNPHPARLERREVPMSKTHDLSEQTNSTPYQLVSIKHDACHATKIYRKACSEGSRGITQVEASPVPDPVLESKRQELESLNEQIEAMTLNPIYRPPWGVGLTAQELISIARHEGINPYRMDWWDGLDSVVIREARQQAFKRPGLEPITELRHKQAALRKEVAYLEKGE